jgi:hypothetical protein
MSPTYYVDVTGVMMSDVHMCLRIPITYIQAVFFLRVKSDFFGDAGLKKN